MKVLVAYASKYGSTKGIVLIVWIAVEVMLIGSPNGFPRFLQVMMALMGIVILALAMLPRVRAFTKLVN